MCQQVQALIHELTAREASLSTARAAIKEAVKAAAKQRAEKHKKASSAVAVIWAIDHAAWSLLSQGGVFAEAEINRMVRREEGLGF